MDRFLAEQQAVGADPVVTEPQNAGSRDVDMESIRSSDRGSNWEYDPDDIDFPAPAQAAEFSGKDPDEDRARAWISKVNTKDRREHVDHFIETLEDPDLADRLTLLRLSDADDLEEVLRARDRAKSRQKKVAFGSGKFRQRASNAAPSAPAKQVRVIQIQAIDAGSDSSDGSDGSDSEMDSHRRIYLAANQEVTPKEENEMIMPDPGHQDPGSTNHVHQEHRSKIQSDGFNRNRCSHCGSKKHSNIRCWRRDLY
ncbi:hypothetical protein PHMEG_00033405 [Phytophthora megakarya]|uniref:Eukaryotic/viral aspartic protease n=1 Tax=Phytophthora megakarya TaxID=4795 RepID=A0A225UUX5_9STRA|nr:hypothetical protein PHMEG_00033405 [Phytophthora megakarya]